MENTSSSAVKGGSGRETGGKADQQRRMSTTEDAEVQEARRGRGPSQMRLAAMVSFCFAAGNFYLRGRPLRLAATFTASLSRELLPHVPADLLGRWYKN